MITALSKQEQQEKAYYAALHLIERIDQDLTRGERHYWTKAGKPLWTLDQVIAAILAGELLEVTDGQQNECAYPEIVQPVSLT